jgi:hypothetical protein
LELTDDILKVVRLEDLIVDLNRYLLLVIVQQVERFLHGHLKLGLRQLFFHVFFELFNFEGLFHVGDVLDCELNFDFVLDF